MKELRRLSANLDQSPGKPQGLPNAGQILLATIAGVGIGLGVMQGLKYLGQSSPLAAADSRPTPVTKAISPAQTAPIANQAQNFSLLPRLDSRMNILLMGVDSNGRDTERFTGCRSDTMMIASLDPATQKVAIVSIPRDSRVRIADHHGIEKINSAHALGGPELAVKTVSEDLAVPIDHYIVIDVQGLKKVFEAMGPVDVLVEKPMHYRDRAGKLNIALEPGINRLDAQGLEEYVRFRHDPKGDIGRIERQQWFMRQVKKKLEEPQVLLKLPEFCKIAKEFVRTDLSVEEMLKLAAVAKDVKTSQIQTAMLPGQAAFINGGSYWLPDPESGSLLLHRLVGAPLSVSVLAANTGRNIVHVSDENIDPDLITSEYNNDNVRTACAMAYNEKPVSIIIRYPRGAEEAAKNLEARLTEKGYNVKYRQRGELSECQHELVIATSFRADDDLTGKLKTAVSELDPYAVHINLDNHAPADFVVVVSPNSQFLAPPPVADAGDGNNSNPGGNNQPTASAPLNTEKTAQLGPSSSS